MIDTVLNIIDLRYIDSEKSIEWYTPSIWQIRPGFRYQYLCKIKGTICFFGSDIEIPESYNEWVTSSIDEFQDSINLKWFKKLISENKIRTSDSMQINKMYSRAYNV